jgi:aminoglycoside 3-N-acetyltransferase
MTIGLRDQTTIQPRGYQTKRPRDQTPMLSFRDLSTAFKNLELGNKPAIAHASLSAFGAVHGGAETVLGALLSTTSALIMPTFTYTTMVTPADGPPHNGITYGSAKDANRISQFFQPEMPADKAMGIIAETLRQHPNAHRSRHPIYSFAGIQADEVIQAQTLGNPFAAIEVLTQLDGWVLLLGVGQTVNTSIHYGEQLAGRRQFIRWALTYKGVVECPRWPGCSGGFDQIVPHLEWFSRKIQVGRALVQAIPLKALVETVQELIEDNPVALLCDRAECERCNAIRQDFI